MPSVLRVIRATDDVGLHVADAGTAPLSDWAGCFGSEATAARMLDLLEPLLLLLGMAGYGVPDVTLAPPGATSGNVLRIVLPELALSRGTPHDWTVAAAATTGLRVCPTVAQPLDLAPLLAAYQPSFTPAGSGWLVLPLAGSDPAAALDDLVHKVLWPALVGKVAQGNAQAGVAVLVDQASKVQTVANTPLEASLPELAANARLMLDKVGAGAMLDAEFDADDGGPTLSAQAQQALGDAKSLLISVATKGLVVTAAESLWDWWHEDEPSADEPADPPAVSAVDRLGFVRALLSHVGTLEVVDSAAVKPPATPLARLIAIRRGEIQPSESDWSQLKASFVRVAESPGQPPRIGSTLPPSQTFTRSTELDANNLYPALTSALTVNPIARTLEFARTRSELEAARPGSTAYIKPAGMAGFKTLLFASSDDKVHAYKGVPECTSFWCAALSLWTLAASGYELDQPMLGLPDAAGKREPHGYSDLNGWKPIKPWMLIDGQQEAVLAMGLILQHAGQTDPAKVPGWTVIFDYVSATDAKGNPIKRFGGTVRIKDLSAVAKSDGDKTAGAAAAPVVKNDFTVPTYGDYVNAYVNDALFEAGTYAGATMGGRSYQDSPAVQYGPGAIALMSVGTRVDFAAIRPGDIGQRHQRSGTRYVGDGHAFQVWSVKVRQGTQDVVLDIDSLASAELAALPAVAYRCIDANVPGASNNPSLASEANGGNGGVSISKWIDVPTPQTDSGGTRYYFARLHESPWSGANLGAAGTPPAPPPPPPAPAPAPSPTSSPAPAPAFDVAAAQARIDAVTAAYRSVVVAGLTMKTKYRNTFLPNHGGAYVAANYGGQTEADAYKSNYDVYLAAMGKGAPAGVQAGMQQSFDAGRIHASTEVNKPAGTQLTVGDLENYCHGLYGVDCIGFVLQVLLGFPAYAAYMPANVAAAHPGTLTAKQSEFWRLTETNTANFEASSIELPDPATWRAMDVICWGGSGGDGHVILIRDTTPLATGLWKLQCAESVGGDVATNGPKTSTWFYTSTADAAGLHWATSEANLKAGTLTATIPARATVRRAKMA